jgi:hypothetical protein
MKFTSAIAGLTGIDWQRLGKLEDIDQDRSLPSNLIMALAVSPVAKANQATGEIKTFIKTWCCQCLTDATAGLYRPGFGAFLS